MRCDSGMVCVMSLLPFTDTLIPSHRADPELCMLADRHYTRQKIGSPQFMPPGRTLVLRDAAGTAVFGWLWCLPGLRYDKQEGYCCTIFRNESRRRSSELILEAETAAVNKWGRNRMFTYVDASKVTSSNPGYCFKMAGWRFIGKSLSGLHLLEKQPS